MKSGLYIVTLNNDEPISVNAQDPRIAGKAIKVTKSNCKFGMAKDLEARRKNYYKTFGEINVNFKPIVRLADIHAAEKVVLSALDKYRVRGSTGRKNEWLEGVKPQSVVAIALYHIEQSGIEYELLL